MKPIRYIAYGVATLLIVAGIYLMTYGGSRGFLVMMIGVGSIHIGRPPTDRPFLPRNRREWINGLLVIAALLLFGIVFLVILPAMNLSREPNGPLSPLGAWISGAIFALMIGVKFLREHKKSNKS